MHSKKIDPHAMGLERRVRQAIAERSHQSVQEVSLHEEEAQIIITGTAPSFYAAQLALTAVRNLMRERADGRALQSAIKVPA